MVPLCYGIISKKIVQNPLTYLLWGVLDSVAVFAAYGDQGNYQLAATLALLSVIAVSFIVIAAGGLKRSLQKWTWVEYLVSFLAALSIGTLIFSSNKNAAWLAITSLVIASIPQMVSTWKNPKDTPSKIYFGFMFANLFSALGGKSFSVNEIGYGASGLLITTIIFLFSLKK